jgi:2-polyprenyl-3-methyl-5-hydroxy-6-metoxy-1,4-benzoquinol methylase
MTANGMDLEALEQLSGKVMGDVGGAMGVLMAYLGDQAGVYAALEEHGPCTAVELADRTQLSERYLLEWLSSNAALGYVTYTASDATFSLTPEQAAVFAHEGEVTCFQGFFQSIVGQYGTHELAVDVFKSGRGRPWSEHDDCCFCGTDRFFRPGYVANLVENWIPALDGVEQKLMAGARIADIGCGHGSSTVLMAERFPNSTVHGYDFHQPSVETARQKAAEAGTSNVEFFATDAKEIPDNDYDFACIFDALHDMGDPVGVAKRIREVLSPAGTFMLVEPMAGDSLQENLHPLGGIFYGFSTLVCVPTSTAQEVGLALGAQAGEARLTEVLQQAGFGNVRRATETPTNMVLEAKV